jgi:hypothetical protein
MMTLLDFEKFLSCNWATVLFDHSVADCEVMGHDWVGFFRSSKGGQTVSIEHDDSATEPPRAVGHSPFHHGRFTWH